MVVGLFMFVYVYMPNTRVRLWPAFVGAVSGGVLWAAGGALFARIVVYSTKTAAVYAGFAVVLLFLVWLYLSWLICCSARSSRSTCSIRAPAHGHEDIPMTGALRERLAMSVMFLVGERFIAGGARWSINELAERLNVPGTVLANCCRRSRRTTRLTRRTTRSLPRATSRPFNWAQSSTRSATNGEPAPAQARAVAAADDAANRADAALLESVRGRSCAT